MIWEMPRASSVKTQIWPPRVYPGQLPLATKVKKKSQPAADWDFCHFGWPALFLGSEFGKFLVEFVDPASGVHKFHLTREKRV